MWHLNILHEKRLNETERLFAIRRIHNVHYAATKEPRIWSIIMECMHCIHILRREKRDFVALCSVQIVCGLWILAYHEQFQSLQNYAEYDLHK